MPRKVDEAEPEAEPSCHRLMDGAQHERSTSACLEHVSKRAAQPDIASLTPLDNEGLAPIVTSVDRVKLTEREARTGSAGLLVQVYIVQPGGPQVRMEVSHHVVYLSE